MLMVTALIWGTAFVAQKSGMDLISPIAFNGIRTLVGAFALIPVIMVMGRDKKKKGWDRTLIAGGICSGLALCASGNIQQIGLYLLCIPASGFGAVNKGDIIMVICAVCFAVHILIIDYFSPKVDGVKLSCIQFFIAGIVSLIIAPFADPAIGFTLPSAGDICDSWFSIFYAGVMSCSVAYTLQILGQRETEPAIASMILCLESVFALIAGMVLLGEMMSLREIIGCIIMFAAIFVANLPEDALKHPGT